MFTNPLKHADRGINLIDVDKVGMNHTSYWIVSHVNTAGKDYNLITHFCNAEWINVCIKYLAWHSQTSSTNSNNKPL